MLTREIRSLAFAFLVLSFGSTAYSQGTFTLDVRGASFTRVIGLNAQGDVCGGTLLNLAGYYVPQGAPSGRNRGWVRLGETTFHTYVYPGSVDTCFFNINERGDLVGRYIAADGVEHGLYVDRHGRRPPGQ